MWSAQVYGLGFRVLVRLIHLLVGDGIPTNYAASRRLWSAVGRAQLQVDYNLLIFRCSAHQANLTVVVAICNEQLQQPVEQNPICAACSRLFKHLMVDYAEEFALSLRLFVERHLQLRPLESRSTEEGQKLQTLYGTCVLPDDILWLYNVEMGCLLHACHADSQREVVCAKAYAVLNRFVLRVEERPIASRFFLFSGCVHTLLLMRLLKLPASMFSTGALNPREDNRKRLERYKSFHEDPSMLALLKRASLCLQLTQHATAIACKESGPDPPMKELASGKVQRDTSAHLQRILANLSIDPFLQLDDVVLALWTTQSHICIRFNAFTKWPYKLWTLSKQLNAANYLSSMEHFLREDEAFATSFFKSQVAAVNFLVSQVLLPWQAALDAGYSLLLQRQALGRGDVASAISYLASAPVQSEVDDIVKHPIFYMRVYRVSVF